MKELFAQGSVIPSARHVQELAEEQTAEPFALHTVQQQLQRDPTLVWRKVKATADKVNAERSIVLRQEHAIFILKALEQGEPRDNVENNLQTLVGNLNQNSSSMLAKSDTAGQVSMKDIH